MIRYTYPETTWARDVSNKGHSEVCCTGHGFVKRCVSVIDIMSRKTVVLGNDCESWRRYVAHGESPCFERGLKTIGSP